MHYHLWEIDRTSTCAAERLAATGDERYETVRSAAEAVRCVIPCPDWLLELRIHALNDAAGALEIEHNELRGWH